ncbi:1,4-dihydroxy-2-naphthoyl-CoA thioesterase 1-like [Vicia villosa]|uniref:1,4-dihydroxy-2-naphthoyl-CoA thioesterase 1-like n=1 Tax=Vicia villosa TaxID=3911 RepID=UPI00273C8083|nr:1,4-dihydroxy-2-naphthoyl-CoA thioesterase 1-like [Vicia villosa]
MENKTSSSAKLKTIDLDVPLHTIGFEFEDISAEKVSGNLHLTQKCCQPYNMLHGGVSALIAEALASIGAHVACGYKRVVGVQLSINHLKPAVIGDFIHAEATPLAVGKSIQVWDVRIWKIDPSNSQNRLLIASSRVTIKCNMPMSMSVPENVKDAGDWLKKHPKL